jgi:hypothetical protein
MCGGHDSFPYPIAEMDMDYFISSFAEKHLHDIDSSLAAIEKEVQNLRRFLESRGIKTISN